MAGEITYRPKKAKDCGIEEQCILLGEGGCFYCESRPVLQRPNLWQEMPFVSWSKGSRKWELLSRLEGYNENDKAASIVGAIVACAVVIEDEVNDEIEKAKDALSTILENEDLLMEIQEPITTVGNHAGMRIFQELGELREVIHRLEDKHDKDKEERMGMRVQLEDVQHQFISHLEDSELDDKYLLGAPTNLTRAYYAFLLTKRK
ncbi:hypothetical protein BDD12DRAFT_801936 [Trichophaea hybrida]|nr:hypothetical protein BDD12DRAFT_801936 [Trichophaea hybrida]